MNVICAEIMYIYKRIMENFLYKINMAHFEELAVNRQSFTFAAQQKSSPQDTGL